MTDTVAAPPGPTLVVMRTWRLSGPISIGAIVTAARPYRDRSSARVTSAAALCLLALFAAGAPAGAASTLRAHAAHALKASDTARLHYISASGSLLLEEGRATGTLPGSMKVRMLVGARFTGSFTLYVRGGAIRGHGSALPKGSGVYESFSGSLSASGGSGRFRNARGSARLYGTFNRNTYALVIQTVGTLYY